MPAEYLVKNPCQDACGTKTTDRTVDGAPVYFCPGCDSEWIETTEKTQDSDSSRTTLSTK